MAAPKKKSDINLLPQEEFDSSTKGRVLQWLLGAFRYIIIVTELIVIFAFVSRFYFDLRLANINEEIDQKQAYIIARGNLEQTFRQTQSRLNIFGQMTEENLKVSPVVDDIAKRLPADTALKNLVFSEDKKINIQGRAFTDRSIQQLLANLSASDFLTNLQLIQVESKIENPEINFSILADLKGAE
jgi:Tfp pilus assembly protein PilN